MAYDTDKNADDIPDDEAKCSADFKFNVGHPDGEGVEVHVCTACLYDLPVEYGDSDTRDLPYRWQEEVVLTTKVPRLDNDTGHVHRGVPVTTLASTSPGLGEDG